MRLRLLASASLATALGSACAPDAVDCTTEARASLQVKVVDAQGRTELGAQVTYTLDGGDPERARCVPETTPGATCDTWVTGYERPGHYVVTATSSDGTRTARGEVDVSADTCHVRTGELTLTLPPAR
jgi:hypothetical protein